MDPTTAFVMALIALVLTAVNISVSVIIFRKAAGRVLVQMNASLLNPGRSLLSNDNGTWGLNTLQYDPNGVELAKVVIENPGRTAATITKVEIRIEGSKDPDLAIAVRPVEVSNVGSVSSVGTSTHRLEPFDQSIYLIDFWSVVNYVFDDEPDLRQINVWASVKVAGQNNRFDSKKHGYWTIRREWVSLLAPYTCRTAASIILAELMNTFDDSGQNPYLTDLADKIEQRLSPPSSAEELTTALQEIALLGEDYRGLLGEVNVWAFIRFGWDVDRRLQTLGPQVIWNQTQNSPTRR